jgi:heptosyltransferase II
MTEPLLARLAARGEKITVAALPWVAPVYRCMPQVAQVIELPFAHGGLQFTARRRIAKEIAGRFQIAYVLPNSLKSALLPLLAGIPKRVGYMGEARIGLLTHRLPNPPKAKRPPMVAFYSALSGETGVEADRPRLQVSDAQAEQAVSELNDLLAATAAAPNTTAATTPARPELVEGLAPAHKSASAPTSATAPTPVRPEPVEGFTPSSVLERNNYAVFVPGAEYGPAKRWPAAHFAALAAQLGMPVLLFGSGKDAPLCDEIIHLAQQAQPSSLNPLQIYNLAGRTPLVAAIWLLFASKTVVTNDSGLMHVAAALDIPQVAIFGSSSPLHTPPLSAAAQVIWLKTDPAYHPFLDCAPCFERTCPLGHTRCLSDVSPQRVLGLMRG